MFKFCFIRNYRSVNYTVSRNCDRLSKVLQGFRWASMCAVSVEWLCTCSLAMVGRKWLASWDNVSGKKAEKLVAAACTSPEPVALHGFSAMPERRLLNGPAAP